MTTEEVERVLCLPIIPVSRQEILEAIGREDWQIFRLGLKGLSTREKIDELRRWLDDTTVSSEEWALRKVQVVNYVNALKRGGQVR